jgi:hypothetical protein
MVLIHKSETGWIPKLGLYVFPVLTSLFIALYFADENLYRRAIKEDSLIEWLTFTFLLVAGSLALYIVTRIKSRHHYFHWFFMLFLAFNFLAGLEEISWGQRVFDLETRGLFKEYSDQNEINLHNTFQGMFHIKTKHVALLVLLIYGTLLPWIMRSGGKISDIPIFRQFILPPMFLRGGFIIAAILMLDFQTGHEEEIGEFFFSICFVIMMLWNVVLFKRGFFRPNTHFSIPKSIPSLSE